MFTFFRKKIPFIDTQTMITTTFFGNKPEILPIEANIRAQSSKRKERDLIILFMNVSYPIHNNDTNLWLSVKVGTIAEASTVVMQGAVPLSLKSKDGNITKQNIGDSSVYYQKSLMVSVFLDYRNIQVANRPLAITKTVVRLSLWGGLNGHISYHFDTQNWSKDSEVILLPITIDFQ